MKVVLHEMSWTEAKEYFGKSDMAILPVGSNEQHGPQNPLGTDHLVAKAIAEEAARRAGVLCLQVIPFGVSSHHRQFWGTIFVAPETFRNYVRDVCLALSYYGAQKIVIVNGHGGNLSALLELARELRGKVFVAVFSWWEVSKKRLPDLFEPEERRHACAEETSLNLALHPHLVDMSKAVDEEPHRPLAQAEGMAFPFDTVDMTSSGVFGRSKTASAERGKRVFEVVVNELVRYVNLLKRVKIEDLRQKSEV